jgi:hypothetical protein
MQMVTLVGLNEPGLLTEPVVQVQLHETWLQSGGKGVPWTMVNKPHSKTNAVRRLSPI